MALFTSLASLTPEAADVAQLDALARFYRRQAWLYDWTRPFILFGRQELIRRLAVRPGERVIDVGCGTGWSFPHFARRGATLTGIEPSPAMRARATARARGLGGRASIAVDPRPYGSHDGHRGRANVVLFSYSLSMIPSFQAVLGAAALDLVPGGRVGVVDFLDSDLGAVTAWLRACHVSLGRERLAALTRLFPNHRLEVRSAGLWRYFVFVGGEPGPSLF